MDGAANCELMSGSMCVTDGANDYGINEQCTVRAEANVEGAVESEILAGRMVYVLEEKIYLPAKAEKGEKGTKMAQVRLQGQEAPAGQDAAAALEEAVRQAFLQTDRDFLRHAALRDEG